MARRAHPPDTPRFQRVARIGFLALFLLIPLVYKADLYAFTLLPKRFLIQAILTVVALFWVLDWRSGSAPPLRKTRFTLPIALYLIFTAIALSQAVNPVTGLVNLAHQLTFALLFFLVLNTLRIEAVPGLLRISAGVGILVSAIGILESRGFDLALFPISNGRPSATFAYRNFAATYLIMNIPLALALWIRSRDLKDLCLGAVSTGAMAVFLIYTRTRGAWIGLAGSALITVLLVGHAWWHWKTPFNLSKLPFRLRPGVSVLIPVLILTVSLSLFPPNIASRHSRAIDEKKVEFVAALASVTNPGADRGRLLMWRHTLEIIGDHPLFGVGPGNWQYIYPRYDGGDMLAPNSAPERPHNELLWIASEIGLPGLGAYLWILCVAATTVVRILRRPAKPEYALYAVTFGASLLAMLGHGLLSFPRELAETSLLFWTGLGILALLDAPPSPSGKKRRKDPRTVRYAHYLIPALLFLSTWVTIRHIRFDKHYLLALQYHNVKDLRSALRESSAALQYGPFNPQTFLLQGDGYQAVDRVRDGIAGYLKGLRYHPHSIQLLGALGTAHARQGNLDRAERYYRAVLEIKPDYYEMYNNLGGVYKERGDLEKAIEISRQVIELNPLYIDAYRNLGFAYLDSDRIDEAIQTYRQALDTAPDDPVLHYELGDAYFQKARTDPAALPLARTAYEQFLKIWKGPRAYAENARRQIAEIQARLSGGGR